MGNAGHRILCLFQVKKSFVEFKSSQNIRLVICMLKPKKKLLLGGKFSSIHIEVGSFALNHTESMYKSHVSKIHGAVVLSEL
jgi:hypothetical protein